MDRHLPTNFASRIASCAFGAPGYHRAHLVLLLGLAFLSGCRRAAFNEFYVENMASEIRALEDRVYEYDSAYSALELENEDLRQAIADLRAKQHHLRSNEWGGNSLRPPPIESIPKSSKSSKPNNSVDIGPLDAEEIDISPRPSTPRRSPPSTGGNRSLLEPSAEPAAPLAIPNEEPEKDPGELLPPPTIRSFPNNGDSGPAKPPNPKELDLDLEVPQGAIPSPLQSSLPSLTPDAISKGKILLPMDDQVVPAAAQVLINKPQVVDTKIAEIGFHETLCRGHNFDEAPGDDGLYLVIVPRNRRGEPLNQIGKLTIVVEEEVGDRSHRIAAWEVTPEELQESLEPIGVSQGFHLSLPWEDVAPSGTRVQVFLKYVLDDGRSLVNRKDIQLRKPGSRQTTWTPR